MTAADIISKCDRIKPNVYSQSQKRDWLNKIETDIRQYAVLYSKDEADLSFTNEENPTMYLPETESDIYVYYLISMIDLSNQEYKLYNNSAAYFNSALQSWQRKHRREIKPICDISISY